MGNEPTMLRVLIGPWVFALSFEGEPPQVFPELKSFVGDEDLAADWFVRIRRTRCPLSESVIPQMKIKGSAAELLCERFQAGWELEAKTVAMEIFVEPDDELGVKPRNLLLNSLQILSTELLRSSSGLFFHAASVRLKNDLGILVPGKPKAGKTTFATGPWIAKRHTDEHALVDLAGKEPLLWGVPFTGRQCFLPAPGSTHLNMVVFVEQGPTGCEPEMERLCPAEGIAALIRNLICFDFRPEIFSANMELLTRLVDCIPMVKLRYHTSKASGLEEALARVYKSELRELN